MLLPISSFHPVIALSANPVKLFSTTPLLANTFFVRCSFLKRTQSEEKANYRRATDDPKTAKVGRTTKDNGTNDFSKAVIRDSASPPLASRAEDPRSMCE